MLAIDADRATLEHLISNPDVERISSDAPVQSSGVTWTSTSTTTPQENRLVRALGMDYWVPDGKGVVVAVIDSGVVANSDLSTAAKYDFTCDPGQEGSGGDLQFDTYGHGSHVASLIANVGASSDKVYRGVAAGASILALKVLDSPVPAARATSSPRSIFASRTNTSSRSTSSTCRSGHPIYEPAADDPLVQAVERAVGAGIAVIVSAGNRGRNVVTGDIGFGGVSSPGNAPSAITVGAVDFQGTQGWQDDSVAPYSSRGPTWYDGFAKPDVVVAGHRLPGLTGKASRLSTSFVSSLTVMPGAGHNFLTLSGTSMAAAVATGVAAQVLKTMRLATGESSLTFDGRLPASMAGAIGTLCVKYGVADCSRYQGRHHAVASQGHPAIHGRPAPWCTRVGARGWRTQPHGGITRSPGG